MSERVRVEFNHFGMGPIEVILDKSISARAFRLFVWLWAADKDGDGLVSLEQQELVEILGSYSKIRTYMGELEKAGHVEKTYDRKAHLTRVTILWAMTKQPRHRSPGGDARQEQSPPAGSGIALPGAIEVNKQTSTKQDQVIPTPAGSALSGTNGSGLAHRNGKLDTKAAVEFGERLRKWYQRQYRRPHPPLVTDDVMGLAQALKGVGRMLAEVPQFAGVVPQDALAKAVQVALENKAHVFPLSKGQPLTSKVVAGHWRGFVDRMLREAQETGHIPEGHDPDLHVEEF